MSNIAQLNHFITDHKTLIDSALRQSLNPPLDDKREPLRQAMLYSLTAPAKRFRPLLCLATYNLFNPDSDPIMPLAVAIEMIHTYSLIHDDLPDMDNDDFRRGQPTCHKTFGNDIAILAGDTLNSYAMEVVARDLIEHFPAERILTVIQQFAESCGIEGLAGGQALDLTSSINDLVDGHLEDIHRRKTGALIKMCTRLPALLATKDHVLHESLTHYGAHLGMLFQITDDILDVTASTETLGKTANKDQEQGKLTFVAKYGLDHAIDLRDAEAQKAHDSLSPITDHDTRVLKGFIEYVQRRNH